MADRLTMMASMAGFTVPSFVLALVLVLIFAVQLGWLPSSGNETLAPRHPADHHPGHGGAAILARFTRSAMLEVLGQPYIRTASAKGLPWRRVVHDHALPNAAIPTVTIVGFMIGSLIAGAVVVESVFAWPGVGRLLVVSVANRDLAVVQAILMFIAASMVVANLTVDIAYDWIDPRMRTRSAAPRSQARMSAVTATIAAPVEHTTRFFETWPPLVLAGLAVAGRHDRGGRDG